MSEEGATELFLKPNLLEKARNIARMVTLDHLRIVLWTILGSSVLVSLLTSVAMMNTTLKKIETYHQRTELAHHHELNYQKKILLAHIDTAISDKAKKTPSSSKQPSGKNGSGSKNPFDKSSEKYPSISKTPQSTGASQSSGGPPNMSWAPAWWSKPSGSSHSQGFAQSMHSGSSGDSESNSEGYSPPPGESKERRLPSVIIIGVSKCGTRALIDYLDLHPNVVSAPREINFFTNVTLYNKGPEVYRNSLPFSYSDQLTVEKSPDYFECEMCPERIIAVARSVKLLLILCNPVDRLVSQYMQLKEKNDKSGVPMSQFESWAVDPMTGLVKKSIPSVKTGFYDDYVKNWFRFFPKNRVHVIDGAGLIKDPVGEMKKVEKFLEIKAYLTSTNIYFNATKGFHCMYSRILKKSHCLGPTKGRPHIPVDPGVYQTLQNFYSPHNEKLKTNHHYYMSWV